MYKLILLDMDGTLLTSDKKISKFTCKTIQCIKKNTKVVLATARGFNAIKPYLEQLELLDNQQYTIAFNGSLVVENLGEKIIDQKIKKDSVNELLKYIADNTNCEWYFYTYSDRVNIEEIQNIEDFISKNDIYKIVCLSSEKNINKVRGAIPKRIENLFQIGSSELTRIEFVEQGTTKLGAVKKLMKYLKIDRKEVLAIGDGENDIDMIEYAGCGMAMGNAMDIVKQHADMIIETNDHDGVAKILIKLMEENYE